MSADDALKLRNPPIVEAVVDIDCDMPPGTEITALEQSARDLFLGHYPKFRPRHITEHQFKMEGDAHPEISVRQGIQALMFLTEDERQLVQLRAQGFSFNRLAPYSDLDSYLPEIERTWRLLIQLVTPVQVRLIRLRYINRFLLPMKGGVLDLDRYLKLGPKLPDEKRLRVSGFLHQHSATEAETRNQVNIVLTAQASEDENLPVILDIEAFGPVHGDPNDWPSIQDRIQSLRALKNLVFRNSLTKRCLKLFQ